MPSRHKTPLLGWHPPAELSAFVRAEAGRRGVPLSVILNEAIEAYRALAEADPRWPVSHPSAELLAEAERTGIPVITLVHQKERP